MSGTRHARTLPLALLLAVGWAGCLEGSPEAAPAPGLLDAPPAWAVGDWWRYRFEHVVYGVSSEFTVVVVDEDATHYTVGFAAAVDDVSMLFHTPMADRVAKEDLAWVQHDAWSHLLRFPLHAGDTWTSPYWAGGPFEVEVTAVDGDVATLSLERGGSTVTWTYDGAAGNLATLTHQTGRTVTHALALLAHGTGFAGEVVVPHDPKLVLYHGRQQVVRGDGPETGTLQPPQGTVDLQPRDAMTYALIAAAGLDADGQPQPHAGMSIEATAPDGTTKELQVPPGEVGGLVLARTTDVAGTWSYQVVHAAPYGHTIIEGIAYDEHVYSLP